MEPVYGQILQKGYGLHLQRAVRSRTGVVCTTDRGVRELKRYPWGEDCLVIDHQAREILNAAGFAPVVRYELTMDGEASFCLGDERYVLEEYVPPIPEEMAVAYRETMAATLASLHLAARGMPFAPGQTELGRVPETIQKRRRELIRCKNWIRGQSCISPVDALVLRDLTDYQERIQQAAYILDRSLYPQLCQEAAEAGAFCHRAYKGDNLRLSSGKRLRVTGFERTEGDLWVMDLADFLRRSLRRGADGDELTRLLAAYESVRPLSAGERLVLTALLIYPHRFLKLVNATYNKRRVCVSQATLQNMRECVEGRRQEEAALEVLFKTLC